MSSLTIFYSPEFCVQGSSYETLQKAAWIAASLERRPIAGVELKAPRALQAEDLLAVHTERYLEAIRTGKPRWQAEAQGFKWCDSLWAAATASSGGAVAASLHALENGGAAGSLSSGLHHARADVGEGCCTFNGLALAGRAAVAAGARRVLILDFDAHGGGGTWSLLSGDPAFVSLDVCTYDFDRVPTSRRWRNVLVTRPELYLPTIERELAQIEDVSSFDLCLYNAGMDPCELSDQGLPGIKQSALAKREQMVFEWCRANGLPVAFVLAGGYLSPKLDRGGLVSLHRETIQAAARAYPH
jgi:acetoin utilization deacetylase AcuC-like enzyme